MGRKKALLRYQSIGHVKHIICCYSYRFGLSLLKQMGYMLFAVILIAYSVYAEENRWSTNGPPGGTVMAIAIHPMDHSTLYAGTVTGKGIFRGINEGTQWTKIEGSAIIDNSIRKIAIHPSGPETIFVATVQGMYASRNSGSTWDLMIPPGDQYDDFRGFLIHPRHPDIIFAGSAFGQRIKSVDGGRNWYEINTSGRTVGVDNICADPNNDSILYFVSGSMRVGLGVWKTIDMGENWLPIQNNIDSAGTGEAIIVDKTNSNILYISKTSVDSSSNQCVYKSSDAGNNWQGITPSSLQARSVKDIDIWPFNHNVIFICSRYEGVFKSTDGGSTWIPKNNGLHIQTIKTIEIDSISGTIYLGAYDDGIYKSTDEGESWLKISQGINQSSFWDLVFSSSIEKDICAVGKVCYQSIDSGQSWSYFNIGIPPLQETIKLDIDKFFPSHIYVSTIHALTGFPFNDAGFFLSTDTGASWEYRGTGLSGNPDYWDMAISYIDSEARRIFLASDSGLYYSDNLGQSWLVCQNGLPVDEFYYKVAVALSNDSVIAAGNYDCTIYISLDRGESWLAATAIPGSGYLEELTFDPTNENAIYVSNNYEGLFKSTNGGLSWANITNNIPPREYLSISGLAINPDNPQNLIVSSNPNGIFQSHNGGDSWETLNEEIDTSIFAGQLAFYPGDTSKIIFASGNRSIWTIERQGGDIEGGQSILPDNILLSCYPNPFNQSVQFQYYLHGNAMINLDIYDIMGRKIQRLIDENQSSGLHRIFWRAADIPSGIYLAKLQYGHNSKTLKITMLK
jgi:photosystem II stability/assembly factor-like uncharacterized protein